MIPSRSLPTSKRSVRPLTSLTILAGLPTTTERRRYLHPLWDEGEGPHDAFGANHRVVHQTRHSCRLERWLPTCAPCTMAPWPMWARSSKNHVFAWKDMDNAVFLDVGSRFHGDSAPVPPQNGAGTNVDICPDPHISRNIGLRMNKGRGVDDGSEPVKFEKHVRCVQGSGHSLGPRRCTWSPGRSGLFGGAILAQRPKQCARRSYPRGDQGRWRRRLD